MLWEVLSVSVLRLLPSLMFCILLLESKCEVWEKKKGRVEWGGLFLLGEGWIKEKRLFQKQKRWKKWRKRWKSKHEVTGKKQKYYYCTSIFSMCSNHHLCDLRKMKARFLTLAKKNCLALFLVPIEFSFNCTEKWHEGNIKNEILKKQHTL